MTADGSVPLESTPGPKLSAHRAVCSAECPEVMQSKQFHIRKRLGHEGVIFKKN